MGFFIYDMIFLILFLVFVIFFVNRDKKNLKREGLIYLYRARWGIELINYVGEKYKKILNILKYLSVITGFLLMGSMVYLLWKNLEIYMKVPEISQIIKAPPIAPLIPYFPKLYGMESFFPPFYFIYFIIALAIVAVTHEFSHGVFMKLFNIKIKSTGFAFLGPFLGAFVEEEKSSFKRKKNFNQMVVLSAGAFANIITAIFFFLVMLLFFYLSFSPGGYAFNTYSYGIIPYNETNITGLMMRNYSIVEYSGRNYYLDEVLKSQIGNNNSFLIAYEDYPAIVGGLKGIIVDINGKKIRNQEDLREFMITTSPNQEVRIKTKFPEGKEEYSLILSSNPLNQSQGYLGIGFLSSSPSGITGKFISLINFKDPSIYYVSRYNKEIANFIYYLFWWVALISFLVGLFNMLPLGILDGGRFFYLTILSITKSEKVAKGSFKIISGLILFVFLFLTLIWFKRLF